MNAPDIEEIFYDGTIFYYVPKRYPRYAKCPEKVSYRDSYTDYIRKDGDKYSNPAWKGCAREHKEGF